MPSMKELIAQFSGEQEAAYKAFRQAQLMVNAANAPGKDADRARVAAELAEELWAMTEAKKDEKGKEQPGKPVHPDVTRVKILRLLQGVAGDKEVPALIKALGDWELREEARCVLDRNPSHESNKALIAALETAVGPRFRVGVVGSLAGRSETIVMAALQKATSDSDWEVAVAAIESLANFAEPANDGFIAKAIDCPCPVTRGAARKARVRLAENLAKSGAKFAAKKVYQAILAGNAEPPQKKAAEMALKGL
jgi:hypothetical protein